MIFPEKNTRPKQKKNHFFHIEAKQQSSSSIKCRIEPQIGKTSAMSRIR